MGLCGTTERAHSSKRHDTAMANGLVGALLELHSATSMQQQRSSTLVC